MSNYLFDKALNIQWNLKNSDSESIVFYFSSDLSEKAKQLFYERTNNVKFKRVYTNLSVKMNDVVYVANDDFHELMKEYCNFYYPLPMNKKYIALTGTNGKSTTVDFIRQLLLIKKKNVLTIGTMGVYLNDSKVEDFGLTSPHYIDLRKTLFEYQDDFEFFAIESSSHALDQKRQYGIIYDYIGWTSFSQDHLDYHQSMEEYFKCKLKLREQSKTDFIVSAKSGDFKERFVHETVNYNFNLTQPFLNISYNQINLDIALGILEKCGLEFNNLEVNSLKPTPGRFNVIENEEQKVVVDFAHTSDSLENVLKAINESFNQHVVCVFGCGGNRDKTKRPLMGVAAQENSDFIIVTSDNPRFEDPEEIIKDIVKDLNKEKLMTIVDRKDAIEYAIENYPESIILVAGKGHENYIDQNGTKSYFSDEETIKNKIKAIKK